MTALCIFTGVTALISTYLYKRNDSKKIIKRSSSISPKSKLEKFAAAGVVFTDGKLILAGYNATKKIPFISGIGGSKLTGETYYHTAIREMMEELFEYHDTKQELIDMILTVIPPRKEHRIDDYIILVYTFKDLEILLHFLSSTPFETPMYSEFPLTLHNLLFDRITNPIPTPKKDVQQALIKPEISHLCLLPVVKHNPKKHFVSPDLIRELSIHL